jgi:uncharacterized RDD family membrane protein YckC/uncharacterized protein YneF (UPF0154 family)
MNESYLDKSEALTGTERVIYNRQDYCGFWRRFAANLLDGLVLGMAYNVVKKILYVMASLSGTDYFGFSEWMLCTIIFWAYMIWLKGYRGATPGYYALGIRIVSINGAHVNVKQILIRIISSFFSAIPFGLGYIWITIDADRQAWHDKIAGTYVIKSGAMSVRVINLPRTGLIRVKLLTSLIVVSLFLLLGLIGGVMYLLKDSDAYRLSKQYISENPWVQQEVGNTIKFGIIQNSEIIIKGASGEANLTINVFGDKGEITVTTMLEKKNGNWQVIKAGYIDKAGNYIDIMEPHGRGKKQNDRVKRLTIL